jgi:hypothetical protein
MRLIALVPVALALAAGGTAAAHQSARITEDANDHEHLTLIGTIR